MFFPTQKKKILKELGGPLHSARKIVEWILCMLAIPFHKHNISTLNAHNPVVSTFHFSSVNIFTPKLNQEEPIGHLKKI